MARVRFQGVSFGYSDALEVLSGLEFQLDPGWTGLVGANGAGKTTLLLLLTGELVATQGSIHREPDDALTQCCKQSVEARPAEVTAFAESTGAHARRLHGQLGLEPWALERWETLSPGERKRWQIGAALAADPEVLLLDEPTNHLDSEARDLLLSALKRYRGVGLVVSHDRAFLEALTTRTLRLHQGGAHLWEGAYGQAKASWDGEAAHRADQREKAKAEHHVIEQRLAQTRRDQRQAESKINAGARMRSKHDHEAQSMGAKTRVAWAEADLGRKVGILRRESERTEAAIGEFEVEKEVGRSIFVDYQRAPKPHLAVLEDTTLEVEGRHLVEHLTLALGREDRIWLSGVNGAGKTTLLHALLGKAHVPPERLLYLPQDLSEAESQRALEETLALLPADKGRVLSLVAALGVEPERMLASAQPSPGEARKLVIARGLARHVWALVLDEPTNHLDLPSIERLEAALRLFPGALVVVTHDADFAKGCELKIEWRLGDGRLEVVSH